MGRARHERFPLQHKVMATETSDLQRDAREVVAVDAGRPLAGAWVWLLQLRLGGRQRLQRQPPTLYQPVVNKQPGRDTLLNATCKHPFAV